MMLEDFFLMGRFTVLFSALLVVAGFGLYTGCNKEENSIVYTQRPLAPPTNLKAYSRDGTSVGLTWTLSADTGKVNDFLETRIRTITPEGVFLSTTTAGPLAAEAIVGSLDEGKIYTFEFTSVARSGSQDYKDSDPVTIRWAAARRYTTEGTVPIEIYEIRSSTGNSGLQFFDRVSGGPKTRPISVSGAAQQLIDVLVDTSISGDLIFESAHRNPLLPSGVQARRTRFSTSILEANSLNIGSSTPPPEDTYIREFVTIGPENINNGRLLYAITSDSNYVRILLQRDDASGTLLFGALPNRRIRVQLSYQITPKVIYARPNDQWSAQSGE